MIVVTMDEAFAAIVRVSVNTIIFEVTKLVSVVCKKIERIFNRKMHETCGKSFLGSLPVPRNIQQILNLVLSNRFSRFSTLRCNYNFSNSEFCRRLYGNLTKHTRMRSEYESSS